MPDVDPRLYTTVIRELIRHENDVTSHRLIDLSAARSGTTWIQA